MRIQIKIVEPVPAKTKNGDPYEVAEVTYKNDRGEVKSYRAYPFGDGKKIYQAVSKLVSGDIVDVQTVKNEKGYLDWVEVVKASDEPPAEKVVGSFVPPSGPATVTTTWQDDQDSRQRSIVRQSSLKAALDFHDLNKDGAALSDVFATAGLMCQWVDGTLVDMTFHSLVDSDIPV